MNVKKAGELNPKHSTRLAVGAFEVFPIQFQEQDCFLARHDNRGFSDLELTETYRIWQGFDHQFLPRVISAKFDETRRLNLIIQNIGVAAEQILDLWNTDEVRKYLLQLSILVQQLHSLGIALGHIQPDQLRVAETGDCLLIPGFDLQRKTSAQTAQEWQNYKLRDLRKLVQLFLALLANRPHQSIAVEIESVASFHELDRLLLNDKASDLTVDSVTFCEAKTDAQIIEPLKQPFLRKFASNFSAVLPSSIFNKITGSVQKTEHSALSKTANGAELAAIKPQTVTESFPENRLSNKQALQQNISESGQATPAKRGNKVIKLIFFIAIVLAAIPILLYLLPATDFDPDPAVPTTTETTKTAQTTKPAQTTQPTDNFQQLQLPLGEPDKATTIAKELLVLRDNCFAQNSVLCLEQLYSLDSKSLNTELRAIQTETKNTEIPFTADAELTVTEFSGHIVLLAVEQNQNRANLVIERGQPGWQIRSWYLLELDT